MKTFKIKTLQDVREVNYHPSRSALPKPAAFILINIRPDLGSWEQPKPRLSIPVTFKVSQENHAQPVKITHL